MKLFLHIALLIPLSGFGQKVFVSDTISIKEIFVNGKADFKNFGSKTITLDSVILRNYSHDNISDLISENTPVFVRNYGAGGIATASLRGTGASYTQIAWNGVNINSPMLGQTDLSIIPAGFMDNITVLFGGSSLALNSGGTGGIINIETNPEWKNKTTIQENTSAGSFGKYSTLLKVKTGTGNFQISTKALIQYAENDFPFQNNFISSIPVLEKRQHASVYENSFMQEFYIKGDKKVFSARAWYQKTARNIPVPIVAQQSDNGEYQKDESLRTMLNYNSYRANSDFKTTLSWFSESMDYRNLLISVNSINKVNTLVLNAGYETKIKERTNINITMNDELNFVNTVNYSDNKSRNLGGLSFSVKEALGERFGITALIREQIIDKKLILPDFLTGIDCQISPGKENFLKLNFSHNSKVPTLNDMYWNPGGNISLRNEYSYSGELAYEMKEKISSGISLTSQLSVYMISIEDMIKWAPGKYNYWTPSNIGKTNSAGVEENINLLYELNDFIFNINAKYSYNRAHILRSQESNDLNGKQIIYSPENLFNTGLRISYNCFSVSWISCFTGKRYTTSDNSEYLTRYFLNNISAAVKHNFGKNTLIANVKIDNLFKVSYQAVEWYPMPGRSYNISLIYQFETKK